MTDPIDTLMSEHRTIEKVLEALEAAADRDLPAGFYERAIEFLSKFADGCHHAKEEDRLFPLLERRGIPREMGPIGVMCHEHVEGRGHIQRMREFLRLDNRDALRRESLSYAALLRQHIQKEDHVLFEMARNVLTGGDVRQLEVEFEEAAATPACATAADYVALADELLAEAQAR